MPSFPLHPEILFNGIIGRQNGNDETFNMLLRPQPRESPFYTMRSSIIPHVTSFNIALEAKEVRNILLFTPERELPRLPLRHNKLPDGPFFLEAANVPVTLGLLPTDRSTSANEMRFTALNLAKLARQDAERTFAALDKALEKMHIFCVGQLATSTQHFESSANMLTAAPELAKAFVSFLAKSEF